MSHSGAKVQLQTLEKELSARGQSSLSEKKEREKTIHNHIRSVEHLRYITVKEGKKEEDKFLREGGACLENALRAHRKRRREKGIPCLCLRLRAQKEKVNVRSGGPSYRTGRAVIQKREDRSGWKTSPTSQRKS